MSRLSFTITVCTLWLLMEAVLWSLGFGFDFQFIVAAATVTTFCAIYMPDRKHANQDSHGTDQQHESHEG